MEKCRLERFKHKIGVPSESTVKRTPIPRGQPSWVKVESVPHEDNSIIVLETSAGKGLIWVVVVGSEATEMEHFIGKLRVGFGLRERKLRDFEDLCFWVGSNLEGKM